MISKKLKRSNLYSLLKLFLTIIIFYIVIQQLNISEILELFTKADAKLIIAAIAMLLLLEPLKAYKWHILSKNVDPSIHYLENFKAYLIGIALSIVTPGALGEFGRAGFIESEKRKELFKLTFVDKIIDLNSVVLMALIGGIMLIDDLFKQFVLLSMLVLDFCILLFVASLIKKFTGWIKSTRIQEFLQIFVSLERVVYLKIQILGLIFFGLFYLQAYVLFLCFKTVDLKIIAMLPIVTLSTVFPITIGGFGIRELTAVNILSYFNVPPEVSFNSTLAHFLIANVVTGIAGLLWYWAFIIKKQIRKE